MNPLVKALDSLFGDEFLPCWERLLEASHQAKRCRHLATDLELIRAAEALADVAADWQPLGVDQPWHHAGDGSPLYAVALGFTALRREYRDRGLSRDDFARLDALGAGLGLFLPTPMEARKILDPTR